ncbi:hypothetical protein HK104_000630 [Borealophlyctis nickersoniae]|nr:hypothetical protein HK104_000630 [Borealophlyctis nickersoniae]
MKRKRNGKVNLTEEEIKMDAANHEMDTMICETQAVHREMKRGKLSDNMIQRLVDHFSLVDKLHGGGGGSPQQRMKTFDKMNIDGILEYIKIVTDDWKSIVKDADVKNFWASPPKRALQDAIKLIERLPRDETNTNVGAEVTARLLDFKTWMEETLALAEAEEEPLPTYTREEDSDSE